MSSHLCILHMSKKQLLCLKANKCCCCCCCCFNRIKSDFNRKTLCEKKSHYTQLINKNKRGAFKQKMIEIESLTSKKQNEFWKYFKSENKINGNTI